MKTLVHIFAVWYGGSRVRLKTLKHVFTFAGAAQELGFTFLPCIADRVNALDSSEQYIFNNFNQFSKSLSKF